MSVTWQAAWGRWGQIFHWFQRLENEALSHPLSTIHRVLRVRLTFGLENVFSTFEPYLSPYPDRYTCLDIVYLFRLYGMVFYTRFTRKDIELIAGGQAAGERLSGYL